MSGKPTGRVVHVHRRASFVVEIEEDIRERLREYGTITVPAPTVLRGVASLWDFAGVLTPRVRLNPRIVDKSAAQSLAQAWATVGGDMRKILPPPMAVHDSE